MLELAVSNVIRNCIPEMLPNFGHYSLNPKNAIYLVLRADFTCEEKTSRNLVHVVITSCREVFYTINNHTNVVGKSFLFYSQHDCDWYTLDFLTSLYFEKCREINPNVAPVKFSKYVNIFDLRKVKVEVINNPNEDYGPNRKSFKFIA